MNVNVGGNTVNHSYWSTGLFECLKDEESCWWGTWCCCLLSGRNAASFEVGSSYHQVAIVIGTIFAFFIVSAVIPGLSLIFLIISLLSYAGYRAYIRTEIRKKMNIDGQSTSDFTNHLFCPCCTVCQEAREAKVRNMRPLDFCYAEELNTNENLSTSPNDLNVTDQLNFSTSFNNISKTSRLIVYLCGLRALVSIINLAISENAQNLVILLLVFLQPFLILFFVYWKSRRQFVSLDYVIKLFAVGFFMSTLQSMVFEAILEVMAGIVIAIILAIENPPVPNSPDDPSNNTRLLLEGHNSIARLSDYVLQYLSAFSYTDQGQSFGDYDAYPNFENGFSSDHSMRFLSNSTTDSTQNALSQEDVRHNIVLVICFLFFMAFVVAAGVEETMKHFAVRCCRFPAPLGNPHTVLVYLMTAALGFATAENIEYVFGTKASPIPGTSIFVGELLVLLIRVLMPIHVICSVLQAASLSKVLMGQANMNLLMILLPAISLHGIYDFSLFAMGALGYAYEIDSGWFDALSFIVPAFITIAGIVWAYKSFNRIAEVFEQGWLPFPTEDDGVINANL